jgi:hypothetical protein
MVVHQPACAVGIPRTELQAIRRTESDDGADDLTGLDGRDLDPRQLPHGTELQPRDAVPGQGFDRWRGEDAPGREREHRHHRRGEDQDRMNPDPRIEAPVVALGDAPGPQGNPSRLLPRGSG